MTRKHLRIWASASLVSVIAACAHAEEGTSRALLIGLTPDVMASVGLSTASATAVLQSLESEDAAFASLEQLQGQLSLVTRSLQEARQTARASRDAFAASQAELKTNQHRAEIQLARSAMESLRSDILDRVLDERADTAQAKAITAAPAAEMLLPPEYRLLALTETQALELVGALATEQSAVAGGQPVPSATTMLLAGYRASPIVATALARRQSLAAQIEAAFESYGE